MKMALEKWNDLINRIKNNDPSLETIDLTEKQIGPEDMKVLAEALEKNTSVTMINLWNNNLGSEGVKYLAQGLKKNNSVIMINLQSNGLSVEEVNVIERLLNRNRTLRNTFRQAIVDNKYETVKALAEKKGVSLVGNLVGVDKTPLELAQELGRQEIANFLAETIQKRQSTVKPTPHLLPMVKGAIPAKASPNKKNEQTPTLNSHAIFTPVYGTSFWLSAIENRDVNRLNALIVSDMNPENISFITVLDLLDEPKKINLLARGGIIAIEQLALETDTVLADVANRKTQKRELRRLEAGVHLLLKASEQQPLPQVIVETYKTILMQAFQEQWSTKLSEVLKQQIDDIAKTIYQSSFDSWKKSKDINEQSQPEIIFWQHEMLQTARDKYAYNQTLDKPFINYINNQIAAYLLQKPTLLELLKEKWTEQLAQAYQDDKLEVAFVEQFSARVEQLYDACTEQPKPHFSQFYTQAAEAFWDMFLKGDLSEPFLKNYALSFAKENIASLPSKERESLITRSIEELLQAFKTEALKKSPINIIVKQMFENKVTLYPVEKIHSTAKKSLGPLALKEIVERWHNKQLEESTEQTFSLLIKTPWLARLQNLQSALNPWAIVETLKAEIASLKL